MSNSYSGPSVELPLDHLERLNSKRQENRRFPVELDRGYARTIIGGMGGSSIAGAAVSDIASQLCSKPVYILRVNRLPSWADRDTLVIAVSYSGNTKETLELYREAGRRGCGVVVITSGGKLLEEASADGVPCVQVTGGHMPRSDIGFVILSIASILDINDPGFGLADRFLAILDGMRTYAAGLADRDSPDNLAMDIARHLSDKVPFFYSHERIQSVTSRWKAQFNENSKKVAASGCFPEFNHNELEGWCHNRNAGMVPVLLRTEEDRGSRYMDVCIRVMEEHGNPFYIIDIPGTSTVESVAYGIVLGDYVSLYVADILGVDPSPVDAITEYKEILNKGQ